MFIVTSGALLILSVEEFRHEVLGSLRVALLKELGHDVNGLSPALNHFLQIILALENNIV